MKGLGYLQYIILVATVILCSNSRAQDFGTFTDSRDGNVYKTVKIGDQVWMAENLKYSPPMSASDGQYSSNRRLLRHDASTDEAYYATHISYQFDESNVPVYGYLYDWETAKEICPDDWHLPSHEEWSQLDSYLGKKDAGIKMREPGTSHWSYTHRKIPATNSSGFTALPGGYFGYQNMFQQLGQLAYFWSSTGTYWYLNGKRRGIDFSNPTGTYNYVSVRCIKD